MISISAHLCQLVIIFYCYVTCTLIIYGKIKSTAGADASVEVPKLH